ncbi:MAG: hypothetical protein AB1589_04455, partial [Cyanobacteriota bacterium]
MDRLLLVLIGLIIGAILTWLVINKRTNARYRSSQERTQQALLQLQTRLDELEKRSRQEQDQPSLTSELSQLQSQFDAAHQEREQLQSQLAQLHSQFDAANQEREQLQSQLAQLHSQFESTTQERSTL